MTTPPLAVIQGRLTPSNGRGIQFFPADPGEWEREFETAASIGITFIQWVWDAERNPLSDETVQRQITERMLATNVRVRNLDFQVLTKLDIGSCPETLMRDVCRGLAAIEGGTLELPLMEASTLLDPEHYESRLQALDRFIEIATEYGISIGIETDLPPDAFRDVLMRPVSIVYDAGNSAGMGYDVRQEFAAFGHRIGNVHFKDKKKGGTTIPLGEGDADFSTLCALLYAEKYAGAFTLQAARGVDGDETSTIRTYVTFVETHWENAANSANHA